MSQALNHGNEYRNSDLQLNQFPTEIQKFFETIQFYSTNTRKNYFYIIKKFIDYISENKDLKFNTLSQNDFESYEEHLQEQVENNQLKGSTKKNVLYRLRTLRAYLSQVDVKLKEKSPNIKTKITKENIVNKVDYPSILNNFVSYLEHNNIYSITEYRRNTNYFLKYIKENFEAFAESDFNVAELKKITNEHIEKYHSFLSKRIEFELISKSRALRLTDSLRLFFKFLEKIHGNTLKYAIPDKFRTQGTRSNEFVPEEDIIAMLKQIQMHSRNQLKDMCIFLLLVDTGCRPKEIVNIEVSDVQATEFTIYLRSKKSGQRKLKLSKPVMNLLKEYLKLREKISLSHESLFLNAFGEPIETFVINWIFYSANMNAFGKNLYPPKAFRHTYITNALEDRNNLIDVAATVGHEHIVSTQYYLEKSLKRLKRNTLPFNPVSFLEEK